MSPGPSVAEIVATIQRLELVPPERQAELQTLAEECSSALQLYRLLVQRGLLTAYQVNALSNDRVEHLLLGPYCILEHLGKGVVSDVYKARHRALGRICTLKVVNRKSVGRPEVIPQFFREAQLATQLNHPNVVVVYDAGQDGDRYYYAMQFVEGKSLAQLVRERGPLPVPIACEYIRQAALAVQHAADTGLLHRHIKPSSLIVTRDALTPSDVVKVLDFGLTQLLPKPGEPLAKSAGLEAGAIDFLAPEVISSPDQADIRADVYSLGCVLYYLLAGRSPLAEDDDQKKIAAKLEGRLLAITGLRKDLPPGLVQFLDRMLALRPQDRCTTAGEVAQALSQFALGGVLAAPRLGVAVEDNVVPPAFIIPPPPVAPTGIRRTRRNLLYLVLAFVAMFVFGALLAVVLVLRQLPRAANLASQPDPTADSPAGKPSENVSTAVTAAGSPPQQHDEAPRVPEIPGGIASLVLQAPTVTGKIVSLAADPYGEAAAILEEVGQVNVYQASDGKLRVSFPIALDRGPIGISWCEVHRLAVIYQDGVEWRDSQRGQLLAEMRLHLSAAPRVKMPPQPSAFSPYLDLLAFPWNTSLILVNTDTQRYEVRKEIPTGVLALAFSGRDETCWLLSREGLYQVADRVQRLEIPKPDPNAEALNVGSISPDGRWAALVWKTAAAPKPEYSIVVWSLTQPPQLVRIRTAAPPQQVVLIPASQQLAALYAGSVITVHDLPSGEMSLVIRSSGKMAQLASARLAPKLIIGEEAALHLSASLRDHVRPLARDFPIVSDPSDPPASAVTMFPLPVAGQDREARAQLRQKYAALYGQLPQSRPELLRQLLEQGRLSQDAAEVLACALELAALSGPPGDLVHLDLAIKLAQDRFFAGPEEIHYLLLTEFSRQSVPATIRPVLLERWEQLAEAYVAKLDIANESRRLKQASVLSKEDAKQ
ncbi:MAG: serine/threonine-protein kinase, partial [Gemmatales bacterium]|nr:serine/threonine protein kinase [Gemmatales bacterium]MDW8176219.1 serine/threonine-protein kinase [Gemmatales bacterium]